MIHCRFIHLMEVLRYITALAKGATHLPVSAVLNSKRQLEARWPKPSPSVVAVIIQSGRREMWAVFGTAVADALLRDFFACLSGLDLEWERRVCKRSPNHGLESRRHSSAR